MYLVNMLYVSRTDPSFNPDDIAQILESSARNNARRGITGILAFNSSYFLQCLEGSRSAVNGAYHAILNDKRHHSPVLLAYHEIHQRQFPQWAMGYIGENLFSQEILLRYSNSSEFKPYELSGQSAAGLLVELASHVPTLSSVPHLKTVSN